MDRLEEHPLVEPVTCLKVRSLKKETQQGVVTLIGEPPTELPLGIFGTFSLREYYLELLWCKSKPRLI